jgi:hypothetical protein
MKRMAWLMPRSARKDDEDGAGAAASSSARIPPPVIDSEDSPTAHARHCVHVFDTLEARLNGAPLPEPTFVAGYSIPFFVTLTKRGHRGAF